MDYPKFLDKGMEQQLEGQGIQSNPASDPIALIAAFLTGGGAPAASALASKAAGAVSKGVMLTRKEKVGKALDSLWDMHNHYWEAGDIDKAKYVADMIDKVMVKHGMAPKGVARPFKDLFRKP